MHMRKISRTKKPASSKYNYTSKYHWQELSQVSFTFVATNICDRRCFFATIILLSQQKWHLWQLPPMISNISRKVSLQDIKGEERRRHQAEDPALPAAQAQEEKTMKSELLMYSRHSPWPLHPPSRHLSIFTFTTTFCVPVTQSTTSELQFQHNACREFADKILRREHLSFGCCCSTFSTFLTLNKCKK